MDIDFYSSVEQRLDDYQTRILALEKALTQLPNVNFQAEPSRLPGVRVDPAPAPVIGVPNG